MEKETERKLIGEIIKKKKRLDYAIKEFREDYCFLSNFYKCNITYKGITIKIMKLLSKLKKMLVEV